MPAIPPIAAYAMPEKAQLPQNTVQWDLDPRRAVLLIHDMQRFFLRPFPEDGPPRRQLVENAARLRASCAEQGVPVAYTEQPGSMSEHERGLLWDFWGPGMRQDPQDREIVDALAPAPGDWRLTKWRYSAFFRSDLLDRLHADGRDQLIVCGVYAHVGVLMTAVDAFTRDIQPFVIGDAVADFSAEYHRFALSYAAQRCARVETTDWALSEISRGTRLSTAGSAL